MTPTKNKKQVTTLDEIRAQAEPEVIEIPGFRPGTIINVAVQPVDLTHLMLAAGIGNPLLDVAVKRAREGASAADIEREVEAAAAGAERNIETMLPIIDSVCEQALVEPTWADVSKIRPLRLDQKWAVFNHAMGDAEDAKQLASFRGKRRVGTADAGR